MRAPNSFTTSGAFFYKMNNELKPKIIVILGPTATGKSSLAVQIAKKFNGEIISADSRQVYKGLDIGSGKITEKEMMGVPHHLLDIANPKRKFSVTDFKEKAEKAIEDILKRGQLPIICGGTGFYIQALVDNLVLPEVSPNISLRKKLDKKTPAELFEILKKLDPKRADSIERQNPRRLIRAIEIAKEIGSVPVLKKDSLKYSPLFIGLDLPDEILKQKIGTRLMERIKIGMIEEARTLHEQGLSFKRMIELGLEYKFLAKYLKGEITEKEMVSSLQIEIWHFVKRQRTWFKRDKRINWFEPSELKKIEKLVKDFVIPKK
ncbi:MAG: tRNA (adenosine(37)-N6)-dimethylallyltransferase MiaA [Patescibacteria group bacterium]